MRPRALSQKAPCLPSLCWVPAPWAGPRPLGGEPRGHALGVATAGTAAQGASLRAAAAPAEWGQGLLEAWAGAGVRERLCEASQLWLVLQLSRTRDPPGHPGLSGLCRPSMASQHGAPHPTFCLADALPAYALQVPHPSRLGLGWFPRGWLWVPPQDPSPGEGWVWGAQAVTGAPGRCSVSCGGADLSLCPPLAQVPRPRGTCPGAPWGVQLSPSPHPRPAGWEVGEEVGEQGGRAGSRWGSRPGPECSSPIWTYLAGPVLSPLPDSLLSRQADVPSPPFRPDPWPPFPTAACGLALGPRM